MHQNGGLGSAWVFTVPVYTLTVCWIYGDHTAALSWRSERPLLGLLVVAQRDSSEVRGQTSASVFGCVCLRGPGPLSPALWMRK